jgi:hypothetical protein
MREAGQQLTSFVRVSKSQACGFIALSLQVSISDAMAAQFCAPSSLPAMGSSRDRIAQLYQRSRNSAPQSQLGWR